MLFKPIKKSNDYEFYIKKCCRLYKFCYNAHDSGEDMKKILAVKQKHLYTDEKNLMYQGEASYRVVDDTMYIEYKEQVTKADVCVKASKQQVCIIRSGELQSELWFVPKEKTSGKLLSEFGLIEIEIYTHKYIRKDNVIALEYDILVEREVTDGYRVIWNIKEDMKE